MNVQFEDTLEPVGILGGLFIIVMALLRLIGMPWATSLNNVVGTIEVVGIVVMFFVGLALIWLSYTGDALSGVREETPATDPGTTTEPSVEKGTTTADSKESAADDDTTTADSEESTADDEEEFGVTLDEAEDE